MSKKKHARREYPKIKTPRMPDGSKFRVNVRFPKPIHDLVHAAAAKTEESVNEFIVQASAARAKTVIPPPAA